MKDKILRTISILIFSVGVIIGLGLTVLAVWADLEGSLFSSGITREAGLPSLKCPVMITADEIGIVRATIENTLDRKSTRRVFADFSQGYVTLVREEKDLFSLEAGESRELEWTVSPEDAAFNKRVILARIKSFGGYPSPDRQGSCGILVFNVNGISGNQLLVILVVTSLALMAVGIGTSFRFHPAGQRGNRRLMRAMIALAIFVILGLASILLSWWVIGLIILVISILLIGAIISFFLTN